MRPTVRTEILAADRPALSWWLPDGASVQHAYRLRADDGFDTGWVEGDTQSFVRLPVFGQSRRSVTARVKVWTDMGESEWSDPVGLEAGLLAEADWSARWIGVAEDQRPEPGRRPVYWLRTVFDVPPVTAARLYITALGLYEAFLDGRRVGDAELTPGGTAARWGCRGPRTSTAATSRCAPSSRSGPKPAGGWRWAAGRTGSWHRPISPRPTSSAASAKTIVGSIRAGAAGGRVWRGR